MKAIFSDRDGTINFDPGYISTPVGFTLLEGAATGLKQMQDMGFLLFVLSNQSGVGRGFFTEDDLEKVNGRMQEILREQEGVEIDGVYCCLHAPEHECDCRKPRTGLISLVLDDFPGVNVEESFFIGDKEIDIKTGHNIGCKTILIATDGREKRFKAKPDFVAANLIEAAEFIKSCQ